NIPSKPFFDGFAAFVALCGLGWLLTTWKREASSFVILWLFFGLLPGFLSRLGPEDPYPARTVMAIPAIMITLSLGLDRILARIESLWPSVLGKVAPIIIAFFVSWFCYGNLRDYFVVFNNDPHTQTYYKMAEKIVAKRVIKDKNTDFLVTVRMGTSFYFNITRGLDMSRIRLDNPSVFSLSKVYNDRGRDVSLIAEGIYYKTMPIYAEYFPDARIETIWDHNFWMLDYSSPMPKYYGWKRPEKTIGLNEFMQWFYFYDARVRFVLLTVANIPYKDIEKHYCLRTAVTRGKNVRENGVYAGGIFKVDSPFENAVIEGLLEAPDYGTYEIVIDGHEGNVYVDDRKISGPVVLYKGLHRIKFFLKGGATAAAELKWRVPGDGVFKRIDGKYMSDSGKLFGLVAKYSRDGVKVFEMLEPSIDYRLYYDAHLPAYKDASKPYADIVWEGYINVEEPGIYRFRLETLYDAKIVIDGKTVYTKATGEKGAENVSEVFLSKGMKKITVSGFYRYIST
ncbi:MAG TPA: hypothetical protein P5511_07660, partial [Candidatus Goldiibacteriota bacterium]|nr:hypothetical protein [Candidatus Goldiibacteriota bacterium]